MKLSDEQLSRLISYLQKCLEELRLEYKLNTLSEKEFTAQYLFPWAQQITKELNKKGLYVRGDGGPSVQAVVWENITFFPDISIDFHANKTVAFEVKVIRDLDPSGSIAKAIGQALVYSIGGYRHSFTLLFSTLNRGESTSDITFKSSTKAAPNSTVILFR